MWEPQHIEEAVAALTRKLEGARAHGVKESAPIIQALEEAIVDIEAVRAPRHHDAREPRKTKAPSVIETKEPPCVDNTTAPRRLRERGSSASSIFLEP
jgi:hypothetical protein